MLICIEYNQGSTVVNNYSSLTAHDRGYMLSRMKYGERLHKARIHAKLTQQQLADKINNVCTQENISKLERSDATGSEFTAQFAEACGVRAMWLAEGIGEMIPSEQKQRDPRIEHVLKVMESLPPYGVDAGVREIDSLAELINQMPKPNGTHG
jgi:transcriptional regulator with XRE-family HTH domain